MLYLFLIYLYTRKNYDITNPLDIYNLIYRTDIKLVHVDANPCTYSYDFHSYYQAKSCKNFL